MPSMPMPVRPRVTPVVEWERSEEQNAVLSWLQMTDGVPNLFSTLLHHPALVRQTVFMGRAVVLDSILPARLRELVTLRVAWLCRCRYEWGHHVLLGRHAGLTNEEILAVRDPSLREGWSDLERALLAAVDDLVEHHTIGDGAWTALSAELRPRDLLEVTFLVGYYHLIAGVANAAGIQPDAGVPAFGTVGA